MKPARPYSKHGLNVLKHGMKVLGARSIDRRTQLGRALAAWRADLVRELGGPAVVTTQQAAVIDVATRTKVMLDSIDVWLLAQPSLVNKRARALLPAVRERQALADAFVRYMTVLGLERRAAEVPSLSAYLSARYPAPAPAAPPKDDPHHAPAVALQETIDDGTDHAHDR